MSRTGKAARFFAAGFDTVAMGALAYNATGGRVAATATEWVLWGAVLAAAVCTLVIALDGPPEIAWVAIGFNVNDAVATNLGRLTGLQVSLLSRRKEEPWQLQASTLAPGAREPLARDYTTGRFVATDSDGNAMFGDDAVTRVLPLTGSPGEQVVALLQKPIGEALEPFRELQRQLLYVSLAAIFISIFASTLIARGIARPVRELADVARRIASGDYSTNPPEPRSDELGGGPQDDRRPALLRRP